ncbi:hypothetical protein QYM36_011219 [Artemia franciscana]|uniref:RNase H type-1 domain-containing protein n=1 Tax=Artemia franciscana TaxID=6661 RepID=A0AA88KYM7_ARTSF|nr:hypothetical protein QYM36_011219 [Artemia franciscana]
MDPGQILLSPAMNVNGPSEFEALSPSFLMNQQNVMQPILQNSLPSNQETLPVGMYQNNLSPIPLTLPVSQFINHNMQVPFYPFPVYMTNQSTSNQTAPGTSIQYATGTTNQGQMPRMIPNLQNIYQKDNQTRTMLKVPKQMPQFPNVYANIPTHNKFEVLPQDEDPLNECESDLNEVINPAVAEGLMDISNHTQKQKWCNASPGTSDVRQSRKQEIRAHTKAQVEIPEQEIFNNQVMLQVNNINEKFSGDYEISKFLKEKTKIKKFEFEINHDRTKMIMFLQNDEDAKEFVDILQDLVLHSDHNPVIVEIGSKYPTGINERRDKFRTGNVNWDDLTAKLKDVNIRAVIEGEAEIDKKIEAFQDHLVCTAKEIVPFGGKEEYNQPFTLKELEDIIQGLPLTSPGPDLIHPHFVRSLPPNWTSALLDILNLAWSQGKFPTVWKYAEAVMIPKGGKDLSKLENHRMISLLPVLGKVYERIVKKRLNFEIERRKLLKDIQCGFRRKRSTIDCLNCIKQDALYAMQNNWIMLLVMLDVEGAFNNIVHRQILSGLIEAGFKGSLIAFVEDYMKQRTIKVRVKERDMDMELKIMLNDKYKNYIEIYTDGSKLESPTAVGAAFWIPKMKVVRKYKLYPEVSVFVAEAYAILKALEFAENPSREIVACYQKLLGMLKRRKISFQWVPAHVGIKGNERVDREAKTAALEGQSELDVPTPRIATQIEQIIKTIRDQSFQDNLNLSGNLFVTTKERRKREVVIYKFLNRWQSRIVFRLRSGHAGVRSYKARFEGASERCEFCDVEETIEHLLLECDRYASERKEIVEFFRVRSIKPSVYHILGGLTTSEDKVQILQLVTKYLEEIHQDFRL